MDINCSVFWDYSYIPKPVNCPEIYSLVEDVEYGSPLILALTWPIISVLVILETIWDLIYGRKR